MSDPAKSPAAKPSDLREARLAAALRDNLKRRKAQMRARAGVETEAKINQTETTSEVRESPQSGGE
jgi:hypothetical protein